MTDQWTPLFQGLKQQVSAQGRRQLLAQLIGEIEDIAILNFGEDGIHRPKEWKALKEKYATEFHDGDQTPTLILTRAMIESFVHVIGTDSASVTNTAEYASEHQEGAPEIKLPARPYFPIDESGQLTPYAVQKLMEICENHFQGMASS